MTNVICQLLKAERLPDRLELCRKPHQAHTGRCAVSCLPSRKPMPTFWGKAASAVLGAAGCQTARKRDPESAPNRDPYRRLRSGRPRSPWRGPAPACAIGRTGPDQWDLVLDLQLSNRYTTLMTTPRPLLRHIDDFGLGKLFQSLLSQFHPDPRLLGAAHGYVWRHVEMFVDPDHAGVDPARDIESALAWNAIGAAAWRIGPRRMSLGKREGQK